MSDVARTLLLLPSKNETGHGMSSQRFLDALAGPWRFVPVLVVLALIWAYFWWANPLFLSPRNLSNLSIQIVVTGVVALGLLFVLIIGEIDLSVAALGAVCAAVTAGLAVNRGFDPVTAVLVGLCLAGGIGAAQGALVTVFQAPSFIVTLGTSLALQGLLLDMLPSGSNLISLVGQPLGRLATIYLPTAASAALLAVLVVLSALVRLRTHRERVRHDLPSSLWTSVLISALALGALGCGTIAVYQAYRGVPLLVAFLVTLLSVFAYVTTQTRFGLYLYAVGANAEAARRSGIAVSRIKIAAFALTGVFAGLGGIIAAGRVLGVSPDSADTTLLLEAIAAAVIGGVSLFGGRGSVWAALTGALVIGSVTNGLLLIDASTQTRLQVQGCILTLAVIMDAILTRRAGVKR